MPDFPGGYTGDMINSNIVYFSEQDASKSGQYERLTRCSSTMRPYYVWRERFMQDRCIREPQLLKELLVSAVPHLLLNFSLAFYIVFGGVFLRAIDESIRKESLRETLLFAFTTITTIGYGNVHPTSVVGKTGCVIYCVIGIPLMFLVLTNNGQFITDAYWILKNSLRRGQPGGASSGDLPLWVTCLLLLLHSLIGGVLFSQWIDQMPFVPAIYFSFISIATIGYGDLTPTPETWFQTGIIIIYMSIGIIILSTLLGSLSTYLKLIGSIGRPVSGSRDVEVWFGGDMMTVEDLVTMVADQFGVSTERLHCVLRDMDEILEAACHSPHLLSKMGENMRKESMMVTQYGTGDRRHALLTRHSYHGVPLQRVSSDSSLQTTITRYNNSDTIRDNALQAVFVINHQLRKQGCSLKRASSLRQPFKLNDSRKISQSVPSSRHNSGGDPATPCVSECSIDMDPI